MRSIQVFCWGLMTLSLLVGLIAVCPVPPFGLHGKMFQLTVLVGSLSVCALAGLGLVLLGRAASASEDVVPSYLHSAFDGLREGILILDSDGRISFCNRAFLELSGNLREEILGQRAKDLSWKWKDVESDRPKSRHSSRTVQPETHSSPDAQTDISTDSDSACDLAGEEITWLDAVKSGRKRCGRIIGLGSETSRTFIMNAVPILDGTNRPRGALVSLEDVTRLRKQQSELGTLLETVRQSAAQIRQQNRTLEELVIHDQLTTCLNRRSGLATLDKIWKQSSRNGDDLSCVMIDLDRFRTINEMYGHQAADQALREVGMCLLRNVRDCDDVVRYGGEEFLVIMPRTEVADAAQIAERLRQEISRLNFGDFTLTASLGVTSRSQDSESPQELLGHLDACLTTAKQQGRNQVIQYAPNEQQPASNAEVEGVNEASSSIPFPAVTALISALAYRDLATAAHSRRVADLCVALGQRLMSLSSCYVLEMAALLHDIGKIGVPDSTLLKPTPLTDEEWEVMQTHKRIGVEIVRASFGAPELSEILENYFRPFEDAQQSGRPIPLGARILAVADAYDSMTTEQIYRSPVSPAEAIAELRRCAGTQFDPEIVVQFIEVLYQKGREPLPSLNVPAEAALALGMELERFAEAVDQQDVNSLKALAGHLGRTAAKNGALEINAKALELEQATNNETDLLGVLRCANELLDYCRATQRAYFNTCSPGLRLAQLPVPLEAPVEELV